MKIVSTAKLSEKHQLDLISEYPELNFHFFENIESALSELTTAEIIITYGEDLSEDIINNCTNLKWLNIISAGLDKIPFNALKTKELIITNARGIHHIPMSEYTMAVILQTTRKLNEMFVNQFNRKWDRSIRMEEIYGKTLGIIGLGTIGKSIAEKAKVFNMKVIGVNTDGRYVSNVDRVYKPNQLKELLEQSDYVVVIVPLTEKTKNLIGKDELKAMKKTAYIINIARGEVINENSLVEALKKEAIAGAILDVFSEEPLPEDHPFWGLNNCVITPHISGRSPHYIKRALDIFKRNLNLYIQADFNNMENLIDIKRGY